MARGIFGRFTGMAASQGFGFAIGYPAGAALTPVVQSITNEFWRQHPDMPLPADVAAQMALKRPGERDIFEAAVHSQGFDPALFKYFVDAADNPPALSELLELLRRGVINRAGFIAGLRDILVPERWHSELIDLVRVHLGAPDLAMARQQAFIDETEQKTRSEIQGISADDAELLFKLAGEPPGPETMIALWRRGVIDETRVRQAVVEGRLKLKYVPDILKLRDVPLSASLAAEAVLRERHLPRDPHYYAQAAGISAEDFDAWVDLMGRPIPVGEALTLARRGEFTQQRFREAVARSDVRTEYADDLWKLREVLPTPLELRRMLTIDAITDELATSIMIRRGYSPEIAAGIVRASHEDANANNKDLAASQIRDLFESGFETRDWALKNLRELGYSEINATFILDLTEAARLIAYLKAALARVKASFVSHKIDESTALDALAQLEITTQQSQQYMALWSEERDANVRRLTDAQIGKAFKLGIIERDDAVSRWVANGYPQADAEVLALLAVHPAGSAPSPTSTTG